MDSMQVNKAIAAVLVAGIAFFITGMLGDGLVHVQRPLKPAIVIQTAQQAPAAAAPAGPAPIAPLLASADVKAGEDYASKVCAACHTYNDGGPNRVGPNLYGVLGRPVASHPGFDYSNALKAKHGAWTYAELNDWLYKPAAYAPGTRMGFAGITSDKTRADVIAWLRSLSPNPEPLPEVEAAVAPAATPAAAAAPAPAPAAAGLAPIEPLLVHANVAAGEAYTKKICVVCHTFNKGGRAGVGPNLYGVVGGPHAHMEGFAYTAALKSKQGPWTFDALNQWLYDPAKYAPGTRMAFAGIRSNQDRADVIAYLNANSDHPEPISAAQAAPPATPASAQAPAASPAPATQPAAAETAAPPTATRAAAEPAATQTPASSPAASGATQQGGGGGTTPGPTPPLPDQAGSPPSTPMPAAHSP